MGAANPRHLAYFCFPVLCGGLSTTDPLVHKQCFCHFFMFCLLFFFAPRALREPSGGPPGGPFGDSAEGFLPAGGLSHRSCPYDPYLPSLSTLSSLFLFHRKNKFKSKMHVDVFSVVSTFHCAHYRTRHHNSFGEPS